MAAGGNPANVNLGPGRLYYAPVGSTEPTSASTALDAAFQAIGYTEDGTSVEFEITSENVDVAEELDPISTPITRRATRVSFAMAEATVKRLALALGGGASRVDNSVFFELPTPDAMVGIMLVWDSAESPTDANNRRWVFYTATPSGTVSIARKKAPNKVTFPVTFNIGLATGKTSPVRIWPGPSGRI